MIIKHTPITLFAIIFCSLLQGCIGLATDHRTISKQFTDQKIEYNINRKITNNKVLETQTNLHFISINGALLIIGQAPTRDLRDMAIKEVTTIEGVVQVHNQIRIGHPTSVITRSNDVWLTTKVKSALLGSDKLTPTNIKVVTENSEVFLMGLVSHNEADEAVAIARNISGVSRVFLAFEYRTNHTK
ncbi:MAG: BON domain-containing protein [Alteromonadaceae bacterium]